MQRRPGGRGLSAVLFTDIVGSTPIAAEMGNTRWAELVARHHRILRRLIGQFGGHEIDTAGDGFFVSFERPADAIRCAVEAAEAVRELGIEIRAGVSFGEVETLSGKPSGLVVNTAARVMAVAGPAEVLVPASLRDIVPGSGITFQEHGVHQLKGLEGDFHLFKVTGVDGKELPPPPEPAEAAERRREIFPTARRRGPLVAGLAAGALAVVVAAGLLLSGGAKNDRGERSRTAGPLQFSVARIDPETGRTGSRVYVGGFSRVAAIVDIDHPFAAGEGGLWVLRPPIVDHVDPAHGEVRDPIQVGVGNSQTVRTAFDAVWVLIDRTLYRINPATDEPTPFVILPLRTGITTFSVAFADAIWLGASDGALVRIDPRTEARTQVDTGLSIDRLATTTDDIWAVDLVAGTIVPFDRESLKPDGEPIEVSGGIDQIAGRGNELWILDLDLGTLTRIDVTSGDRDMARVGDEPTDMAFGLGAIWVGDRDGSLYRVDPVTLEATAIPIGADVAGVAVDEASDSLWVYVGKATEPASP